VLTRALPGVLLCALLGGCLQELDPTAANGRLAAASASSSLDASAASSGSAAPDACAQPFVIVPTGEMVCGDPDGDVPVATTTPPIVLPDGATTDDPAAAIEQKSLAIRETYCAGCHAAPATVGGFGVVLDDRALLRAVSTTVVDDAGAPVRLVVPGNADGSRLYQRVLRGEMPPQPPRPSVSDVSVLREWILTCLVNLASSDGGASAAIDGGDGAP
jgi:hypothetical protein